MFVGRGFANVEMPSIQNPSPDTKQFSAYFVDLINEVKYKTGTGGGGCS